MTKDYLLLPLVGLAALFIHLFFRELNKDNPDYKGSYRLYFLMAIGVIGFIVLIFKLISQIFK